MGARIGLRLCYARVDIESFVIVHVATVVEHTTVAMAGVLVHAEVSHKHQLIADIGAQRGQCPLHNSLFGPGLRTLGILGSRNSEQDDAGHTEFGQLAYFSS